MPQTQATISIALEAQTAQLKKGFAEGRQEVRRLADGLSGNVAAGLAKFQLGLLAIKSAVNSVQGAVTALLDTMAEIDAVEKFAARIGVASDQLRILNFAAEQTGAGAETMQMALQRMTRRISEAANGTGEAVKALIELNLSAEELSRLAPDKQFGAIADAMANVENKSDKVRLSMKLFDSEGVALVNTLAVGTAGLNAFGAEAEQTGMLIGNLGKRIEDANDAMNRMRRAWGGIMQQIAVVAAPILQGLAVQVTALTTGMGELLGLKSTATAKSFAAEVGAATDAMKPLAEEVDKVTTKTLTAAERAQEIIDKAKKDFADMYGSFSPERGVGAVTRGSSAGFSAIQEAYRSRRDAERRDAERNALLRLIYNRLGEAGLSSVVEVSI